MKIKKKGNVLMITLIVLLTLMFHILLYSYITISQTRNFQMIKAVNQERMTVNLVIAYIKYTNQNDILLSDYISFDNQIIDYTVDDMGDYFYIKVSLSTDEKSINFDFDLNKEKNYLTRFEYLE